MRYGKRYGGRGIAEGIYVQESVVRHSMVKVVSKFKIDLQ